MNIVRHAVEQEVTSAFHVMKDFSYQEHNVWVIMLDGRSGSMVKDQVEELNQLMGFKMGVDLFLQSLGIVTLQLVNGSGSPLILYQPITL